MEEKDFERMGQMVAQVIDAKLEGFKSEIVDEFHHQLALERELFQRELSIVAEGHLMLSEKLDRVESRFDQIDSRIVKVEFALTEKLNKIATDVNAHRADTEAHRRVYRVKES